MDLNFSFEKAIRFVVQNSGSLIHALFLNDNLCNSFRKQKKKLNIDAMLI